ncbi:TIGR03790 family protein [Aquincola tertiaricarbonis]|uniref:TIGR03790 family protein n=1 Tax=Aquincola tertiaricarbonis TaxID=391953 RepID=UPI001E534B4B|nr:TIGR03790 family protein [Aquincola tertiaricarbonis]
MGTRLMPADIGLVINTADPYSVAVGAYYIERRGLKPRQVLRLELPMRGSLTPEEFAALRQQVESHFGDTTQALALAWTVPYGVQCQSITGALALGFDADFCRRSCDRSRPSPYFNSASSMPWRDHQLRPSMLLAARDVEQARRLIDRGVSADGRLGRRWSGPANALFLSTTDAARNVRHRLFPPAGPVPALGLAVRVEQADQPRQQQRLLLLQTGTAQLSGLDGLGWVDGALADHLTSFGGQLDRVGGQSTALEWLDSGATASYGTVSEPCNHLQKFPHPQVLLLHYAQGATAIEAYWKSVAWPLQGVFVGEPLAAPFGPVLPAPAGGGLEPVSMRAPKR